MKDTVFETENSYNGMNSKHVLNETEFQTGYICMYRLLHTWKYLINLQYRNSSKGLIKRASALDFLLVLIGYLIYGTNELPNLQNNTKLNKLAQEPITTADIPFNCKEKYFVIQCTNNFVLY